MMIKDQTILNINPSDLPAPPQAAIEIMRACSQEYLDNDQLADLAAKDPVLAAELLRIANSVMFGFAGKVHSISRAISLMGHRAFRNLALCLSVKGALKNKVIPGLDISVFWEFALRHAICARIIGKDTALDSDECFTAGLLQVFGMLVLLHLNQDKAAIWPELNSLDPDGRREKEMEHFGIIHEQVTMMLAESWSLPDDLTQALGGEKNVGLNNLHESESTTLSYILDGADWMAAVFSSKDKFIVLERCKQKLNKFFTFNEEQIEQYLNIVPEQVEEAAEALGLRISKQNDFNEVLREANVQLTESNLNYQDLTWRLEKALEERDLLAAELDRELKLAREIQQTLLPSPKSDDFPVNGINVSARYLSGDFYDYYTLEDGRIYFTLGDVSGKGTTAALMMAKVSSLFHCIGKRLDEPSRLMSALNDEICETTIRGMFITMVTGLYEPESGSLQLVNAGHPPLLILNKNGKPFKIGAKTPPLGVVPGNEFPEVRLTLGDRSLYIYSDGVTEGHISEGKELGVDGLIDIINKLSHLPPQERLTTMISQFDGSSHPLRDDITLLLLEDRNARI